MLLAFVLLAASVQAISLPASDADRVNAADEIVRGTITGVQSRWNDDHTHIVTTAAVAVAARIKGPDAGVETVAVLGGTVDGVTEWAEGEPALVPGSQAYVFLRDGAPGVPAAGRAQDVVALSGGTVPASARTRSAGVPVGVYDEYLRALVRGESPPAPAAIEPVTRAVGDPPVISSVLPNTASAGTGTTVTITGAGFGTKPARDSRADVGFLYRWDGSSWTPIWASGAGNLDENENDIISWTDTRIIVRVPTGIVSRGYSGSASSGFVYVRPESGPASASYPFTVTFGYGGTRWNAPAPFLVNPGTVAGAATAVQNAAATWNAAIPSSNFRLQYTGTTTASTIGYDGQNVVCFRPPTDFSSPETLAQAYYWYYSDGSMLEADVRFNTGYTWTSGTASGNTVSVQAIALHELGHWLNLRDLYGWYPDYPSDRDKVMFGYHGASMGNQNLKSLHAADKAGIQYIYPPDLTVASISPGTGVQGETLAVTVTGIDFQPGAALRLTRAGQPAIAATGVAVASSTKLTGTLALPLSAATGAWDVEVANPGGVTATKTGALAVFDRPPPDPVADLRVTETTATSLSWAWTDPSVRDFVLVRTYLDNREAGDVARGLQACTLTGLQPDTPYIFSTRAYDSLGNPSSWVNRTASTAWDPDPAPIVVMVPGGVGLPTDTDGDGVYDDVNGNRRRDFADVVLDFNQMGWIAANEPVAAFDCNDNGRIDFADVVWLFNHL